MSITFGNTGAPSNITTYLDSVFETSLANYRKELIDNIGATNALLYAILRGDAYESADGGTYFDEPLMYGLAPADSYDGYDELGLTPIDGITSAIYQWRQCASPIVYNMKEVIQNQRRIIDLVKSKIKQSEMGLQEYFAQALMWGAVPQGGLLTSPRSSPANGSLSVEPLAELIAYNSTTLTVGNISEASPNTWWRCKSATSAATTYSAFIFELENMYNTCALGTGGPPDLILMDQVTYQLFVHAYFSIYKANPDAADNTYPFVAKKFFKALVVMDDKVPDFYSGAIGTQTGGVVDSSTLTYGTAIFINTKFFKIRYHPDRDFTMLEDENGKKFAKPINGDSRVGHLAWMGNVTVNNRRKQGVLAKIARTLS
jgi:hypothetical protein